MFAVASLVTPFALGAAAGGIAAERVPVGNAAGNLITSWLNPTSILIGLLAVAFSAYLAAVYLAADAARRGETDLVEAFRVRALGAGAVAGGLALAGLIVVHADDHPLYTGLVHGAALAVLILSVVVGTTTMGLNAARRFELARYTAALAVALVVADWAFARWPTLLPGLTVDQAAAPHDTMVAVVVAVLAGAVLLFPALALLFTLTLRGHLGAHGEEAEPVATAGQSGVAQLLLGPTLGARLAVALLIVGIGLLNRGRRAVGTRHRRRQPARLHPRGVRGARAPRAGRGRLSVDQRRFPFTNRQKSRPRRVRRVALSVLSWAGLRGTLLSHWNKHLCDARACLELRRFRDPQRSRCRPAGGERRRRRPSRAEQGSWSRRRDARRGARAGLGRSPRAASGTAGSRRTVLLRGSIGDEAVTRGEARDQFVCVGRRLRSRFATGDRLLRFC